MRQVLKIPMTMNLGFYPVPKDFKIIITFYFEQNFGEHSCVFILGDIREKIIFNYLWLIIRRIIFCV